MNRLKYTLIAALMLLSGISANAQSKMTIGFKDGSQQIFDVSTIEKMTWSESAGENTGQTADGHIIILSGSVDLGLSVKWATCNIGASTPGEYGDYYAWGETTTKSTYNWSTYTLCGGSSSTMTKYCTSSSHGTVDNKTFLDPEDDVAHVKLGGNWRMPTAAELTELRTKCTWVWTQYGGHNGYVVIGSTGNAIFLPAAGYRYGSILAFAGSHGYYWSSSLNTSYSDDAWYVDFGSTNVSRGGSGRYSGQSVRAVLPQ